MIVIYAGGVKARISVCWGVSRLLRGGREVCIDAWHLSRVGSLGRIYAACIHLGWSLVAEVLLGEMKLLAQIVWCVGF